MEKNPFFMVFFIDVGMRNMLVRGKDTDIEHIPEK